MVQQKLLTIDDNLRTVILKVLNGDHRIPSNRIRVGVMNNIVHLAGNVSSKAERDIAEELAKKVPGVVGVVNRIDSPDAPSPARTVNIKILKKNISNQEKDV